MPELLLWEDGEEEGREDGERADDVLGFEDDDELLVTELVRADEKAFEDAGADESAEEPSAKEGREE